MHGQATPRPKLCSDLRQRCQGLARRHCSNLSQVRFAQPPGGQPGATPNMARVGMDRLCSSEGLLGKSHRLRCQVLVQHLQSQGAWPHRLQPIHLTQLQAILAAAGIPSEAHIASASALLREKNEPCTQSREPSQGESRKISASKSAAKKRHAPEPNWLRTTRGPT